MSLEDFEKTIRYILDENQLSKEEVKEIYLNIKECEIKYFSLERMLNNEKNYFFTEYEYFCKMKVKYLC